ncbi:MAG TPA: SgcJ/EcaC family oxidoreductase [Actinoplanes sp.]|jgi:uncharacterized protein (TIGR02246 family)
MSSTKTTDAVRAVIGSAAEAWAANDVEAFVGHYAEEATAILPGFALLGRAAIRTAMGAAFAGPLKGTRRIHQVQGVRFLDDTTALVTTRSSTEPPADQWSIATWVLSARSGRWLIEAYHDCPAA